MTKALCSLPWLHLATHPHGGATLCCQSEMENGLSAAANFDGKDPITLNERSIPDLINSKTFKEVRLAMLRGEFHPACGPCWERERLGVMSKRQFDSRRFPLSFEEAKSLTAKDGSIKPDIQFAELRLGNTCNIKCITCNPNSSNTLGKEYEELRKKPEMKFLRDYSWVKPDMSNWTKDEKFWDSLSEHSSNFKEVYINGGEPMLIKQHMAFLEKVVKDGRASKVRLTYSINMTKLIENLRPYWKEFAEIHFACSIDAWDNQNFYIRYPSPWKVVTENFAKLRSWGHRPHVVQTISALNFYNLDDFYEKWQSIFPESVIAYNDVFDPPWFSPLIIHPDLRHKILEKLKKKLPQNLSTHLERMYGGETHSTDLWPVFKRHIKAMDDYRSNNVLEYFPELEAFLNLHSESLR